MKQADLDRIAAALTAGQETFPAADVRQLLGELRHLQRENVRLETAHQESKRGWEEALRGWERAQENLRKADRRNESKAKP